MSMDGMNYGYGLGHQQSYTNAYQRRYASTASTPSADQWWYILETEATADAAEIQSAYHRLAKCCHPDMPGGSEDKMKRLNAAYEKASIARKC